MSLFTRKLTKRTLLASALFSMFSLAIITAQPAQAIVAVPTGGTAVVAPLPTNSGYNFLAQLAVYQTVSQAFTSPLSQLDASVLARQQYGLTKVRIVVQGNTAINGSYVFQGRDLKCDRIPFIVGGAIPTGILCTNL